jgi:hypothetical protein
MAQPQLTLKIFQAQSESMTPGDYATTDFQIPDDYKIISGGARVNRRTSGNMLLSSYPALLNRWIASSKDQVFPEDKLPVDPTNIDVWVTTIYDPDDEWDVRIFQSDPTSPPRGHNPNVVASLPVTTDGLDQYVLTGGGARSYTANDGASQGNFLTASCPDPTYRNWIAASQDHRKADPERLDSYAIGLRWNLGNLDGALALEILVLSPKTGPAGHVPGIAPMPPGYILLGGGAQATPVSGTGNFLTSSAPTNDGQSWYASSEDHAVPAPATLTVYAIGVRQQSWMTFET